MQENPYRAGGRVSLLVRAVIKSIREIKPIGWAMAAGISFSLVFAITSLGISKVLIFPSSLGWGLASVFGLLIGIASLAPLIGVLVSKLFRGFSPEQDRKVSDIGLKMVIFGIIISVVITIMAALVVETSPFERFFLLSGVNLINDLVGLVAIRYAYHPDLRQAPTQRPADLPLLASVGGDGNAILPAVPFTPPTPTTTTDTTSLRNLAFDDNDRSIVAP